MFPTDQPSAVLTLPTPAPAGTQGYFTNGDAAAGIPPTILDADFMNMVMMELLNVITAAGLTPSKSSYTQLLTAIRSLGVNPSSLTANGFLKLANGFIFQWGSIATSATIDLPIIYTTPFPTAVFKIFTSASLTTAGAMTGWNSPTLNGFNINGWSTSTARIAVNASWLALGM